MRVHSSPLNRLFEKKNGGAKGRKEEKSRRWEIHSEDVYAQYCGYNTKNGLRIADILELCAIRLTGKEEIYNGRKSKTSNYRQRIWEH